MEPAPELFMSKAGAVCLSLPSPAAPKKACASCPCHTYPLSVLYRGKGCSWKPLINKLLYQYSLQVYFTLLGDVCSILCQGNVTPALTHPAQNYPPQNNPAENNHLHPKFHGSKEWFVNLFIKRVGFFLFHSSKALALTV